MPPTKESRLEVQLAVALGDIYGVIYLKDIVKPGIRERFDQLRGWEHVLTGDNRLPLL